MTGSRLLSKLLRFKGFRVVSWWFEGRSCFVIAVKPHKNGCCCPECGRRGKIVRTNSRSTSNALVLFRLAPKRGKRPPTPNPRVPCACR